MERAADIDTNDRRVVYVTVNKSTGNMAEAPSKKPKKTRRPAFTEGEKMALVESFSIHADTLQSPLTNTITNETKRKAWDAVTIEKLFLYAVTNAVNAVNPAVVRTLQEVKKKWKNLVSRFPPHFENDLCKKCAVNARILPLTPSASCQ